MKHFLYTGFFCMLCINLCFGQQANYNFNNFGNRSILLSGNVTGSVSDLGLAYYNPARLTQVKATGFAINAKAYQFTSVSLTDVFGESSKVANNDFNGVPSMAGASFNLFGTRFAYSYLTKLDNDTNLNYSTDSISSGLANMFPKSQDYLGAYNVKSKIRDEWMGITWAKKIGDKFSVGFTVFGTAYNYTEGNTISHTVVEEDNSVAFYQKVVGFSQESYGLIFKIGANYNLKKAEIGINIGLPYIGVYDKAVFSYKNTISGQGPNKDLFYNYYFDQLEANRKEPFSFSIGSGIPFNKNKNKIHLNIDYVSGLSTYQPISIPDIDTGGTDLTVFDFDESRKAVINFGVGVEFYLKENLKTYAAFSTDYNGFKTKANILDLSNPEYTADNEISNLLHLSYGIDWRVKWANLILGLTYTGGSSEAVIPDDTEPVAYSTAVETQGKYTRWQFVVGIEVPFLDKKFKSIAK
ncbi:hypothetical protein [Formosa sp. PL04]|uniref:hypothetical protein n=1 Tax=Formosa sp. PL04 TaxID=3081755 RepID=UPI0029817047|nr:hypothetical protein [Formosa sp. PL04]MDW5289280.1 hypothetical protein [Formosa sp. PL04]